ncbi:MAG TPA: hypothetical protein VEZ90_04290 [Blastocatellia bacterium]|nr:hypothetical protein [Blastocatellia bacterium]
MNNLRTTRRRQRQIDPVATPDGVRSIIEELRDRNPDLIPNNYKRLVSLLNAVRHVERYSANDTPVGRPSKWSRDELLLVGRQLRSVLQRGTHGRVSVSSFVGVYLRILQFPSDVAAALEDGRVNLQEATLLARLNADRLGASAAKAEAVRREVLANHLKLQGSQNSLRARVNELVGQGDLVSTETMAAAVEIEDELLKIDPEDRLHLFYETIRTLFYAMREIGPEDIDEKGLEDFSAAADDLFAVIQTIRNRRRRKESPPPAFHI